MPETTLADARVQALLDARDVAVLATTQPDGAPLAMAMWFVHDERAITMISIDGLQKVRNMRRDARVCVVVESSRGAALRCASIRGDVVFVERAEQRRPLVEKLVEKYADALRGRWQGGEMPPDRVMFQVVARKVFYWGHGD